MEIRSYHSLPQEAVLVRTKVFVEEQGFQNEFDDIDDSALHHSTIFISGGRRGLDIEVRPEDLIALTNARTAPIQG